MAFYSYLSTKIIIAFITKSYKDLFGVRSYINALAKSISSVSWSEFFRQLEYKCEWYGRNLIRIGRFEASSKTCICGYVNSELKLSDRKWVCPKCGRHNDRDILASVNIKRFGLISPLVEGVEDVEWSAVVGTVKRQYVRV